ncbi:MAG TPA: hypothetical protein VK644_15195 [Chitinophagaceae bacterium]|nr:hypothetical protein [Chitinophagaceae bacterium]
MTEENTIESKPDDMSHEDNSFLTKFVVIAIGIVLFAIIGATLFGVWFVLRMMFGF